MTVRVMVPGFCLMILCSHVVLADVLLLFGLDVLRTFALTIVGREYKLMYNNPTWSLPFTYASGHVFVNQFPPQTDRSDAAVKGAPPGTPTVHLQ